MMKTIIKQLLVALITILSVENISATNYQPSKKDRQVDSLTVLTQKAKVGDAIAQNTLGNWYYTGNNVEKDYTKAASLWAKSAKQENPDAVGNLAICYQLGRGLKADSVMALKLYMKAIELGNDRIIPQHESLIEKNPDNLFSAQLLYLCYSKGIGVKVNLEKAAKYNELLADKGDVEKQFRLALDYLNRKDSKKAATWFKKAMRKGHIGATFYYGKLMFQGSGIEQDKTKGIELMAKAAKTNFPGACLELGKIYLSGDGTEKNVEMAVDYLRRIAGVSGDAGWLLAKCYLNGEGVNQDYYFASQWMAEYVISHENEFNKILKDDDDGPFSKYLMGLKQFYVFKNYDSAISYFKVVEKAKHLEGVMMIGMCYAQKDYTKYNAKKASKFLAKATEKIPAAKYYLSACYEKGNGVEKNLQKSVDLLKEAANDGVGLAQCELGNKYMKGDFVSQDYVKAAKLYLQAESQKQLTPEAAKNLAECYKKNISVLPDLDQAKKRIEILNKHQSNNKLIEILKHIDN